MLFGSSNKQKKILTAVLVVFIVVNVFGLMLLLPTPAYAQWVVTDPITGANTTIRNITDFIRVVLIGVLGTALLNGVYYFAQKIAYDSAVWLASGGEGQGALVFQEGFGEYLENTALDAVGEVIGSVDLPGFDLCRPPNLSALLGIQLGIAQRFQPPAPRCSWNDISQNWDAFVSSATSGEVLEGLANSFRPGQSGLEVAFALGSRSHEFNLRRQLEATENRKEGNGFRPVTDIISGSITTPAQAVRQKSEELVASNKDTREQTLGQAGSALAAGAFQLLPATLTIFANTLLSGLTNKVFEGLFAPEPLRERGPLLTLNPEASGKGGRARAQAVFADLLTPKFAEVQNYDALTEFMTCPGTSRGPNNCVIDAALASVIRVSDAGVPLTVSEAMKQGALRKDWRLVPSGDGKNQDPNCYAEAYCYSNLAKLRRARIIPIGWELAAEQGARLGVTPTVEEVVNRFYDCDPVTGGASDSHPWCHLIDPNWVFKYPETQCRALVKGPTLLAAETSVRADTCVDPVSCLAKDDNGSCVSYGYCTREQNVWDMPGKSCPARYDSCQSYSKITSDNKPDKETFLLTNTADFNGCSAEAAGCKWYSTARAGSNLAWQEDERIYFNRNAASCSTGDAGCADLILKGAGVSKNLLKNSSFEVDDVPADNQIDFWGGIRAPQEQNYSRDGSQSFNGASAIRVGDESGAVDGPLFPSERVVLEAETTYTFSFYAKQAAAGGAAPANAGMSLRFGDRLVNMTGRTNCLLSDGEPELMVLTMTPGDLYRRASCAFTTPAMENGARPTFDLYLYGNEAFAVWVDAVQLEEGLEATEYRESGYPQNAAHAFYKIPPDYLGCAGDADDPAECANYTLMCAPEDINCELYTPVDGSPSVPGVVASDKLCPAECVGYTTFRQEETSFERAKYPLYFIASTGDKCEAQYAGCDEFTNLESGAVEYYSYLRQCVRPGPESAVYYTWEGSDTTGFQLKVWNLMRGSALPGREPVEVGRPPAYRPGFTDFDTCAREVFRAGSNPDCREFYDADGNISYRLYSELIVSTSECSRYRRSEPTSSRAECEEAGGVWDDAARSCSFLGYPRESRSCPATKNGCRSYTGDASRNIRILTRANFENGQAGGFAGELSSESVYVGGHSLQVAGGRTSVNVGAGINKISNGGTYLVSFTAKGSGRPVIRFSGAGGRLEKYFANADFEIGSDWQRYSFGPVLVDWDVAENEALEFSGFGEPSFIDDFELRHVSENIYLIKDSWVTPASCDQAADGSPFPQAQLNCGAYRDRAGTSVTLTSFDRLCREEMVGCRAVIDTKNSLSLEEERYNLACSFDGPDGGSEADTCNDVSCACQATVNGAVRNVCQINRGQTSCKFNSIGPASPASSGGITYAVSRQADSVVVSEDIVKYLILDESKACKQEAAGCTLYGKPETGVCDLGAACASLEGRCDCAISGDVVCQAPVGERTCNYNIPRYFLDGSGANYGSIVLKNDPSKYGETLCASEHLGCEEWSRGAAGLAYFKDPGDQQCEYKENVTVAGVTTSGWFKTGLINVPCDRAFVAGGTQYDIRKNGDTQYRGWTGQCQREYVGCTGYLDPADSSEIYPQGRPYYVIKDKKLEEGNDCAGRVSQKAGCVLFKDTSVPLNQYSSAASYAVSAHDNYGLVPVSSCPGGAGCKVCRHSYMEIPGRSCAGEGIGGLLVPCASSAFGQTCVEDRDCEDDTPPSLPGYLPTREATCVDPGGNNAVANDSNVILKVTRDRQCSEWLDCKTQVTVWDNNEKKFKKVCTQLGRCDSYIATNDGIKCANYKTADYSGDVLTADTYVNRDISWYGEEYAGFSIPNHYPIEELQPIDYDKTAKQDIRLAYVACEQDNGPDRNCDLRENAKTGSCRRAGFACGAPNALGNRGICVNPGGVGAVPLCVYGIDGSSAPAQPEAKPRRESNVLARALPAEQCRAYPEGDSPFPADVSDWTQSGLPLGRKAGFAQANICEKFAWIDRDGDGARDTKPEWPDPRAELIPQDCECDYSKAIYNGKAFTKYFGLEEGNVPQGICQGGPRSGELCAPEAKFNEKKDSRDPENLKTCGPQTQGGICQRIERIDKVVGLSGQCLERDLSLSLNGIPQNYACLTWNPLGIVPGGVDIYNQYAAAGYAPTGSTGRYFCVEAEGQAGNVNQSYEAMYTRDLGDFNIGADAANVRDAQGNRPEGDNGQFYREEFLTAGYIASDNADNRDLGLYEKDIAAIRLTTSHDFRDQDNTEEDAIKKAIEDGANILSRTGRTGITAEGRLYWEATFNIPSGTGVEKLFLNEDLAQKAVLGEGGGRQTKNDVSGCSNTVPGNMYFAVRALFDASPARKFLGMWTSFCDGRNDHDIAFLLDATVHYAEPCVAIARVEGSNAAFTDRVWSGAGYQASNENISVNNLSNSPYGDEDENTYREFFMLGYGYEQRNTPWGSAVSTQEPFGAEAWQVNGPEGYGSPYLKYIPAAPDAGSPYGCFSRRKGVSDDGILAGMSCGALGRCAAAPTSFGASISKNEGNLCQNRSSCPLQSVCSNSINTVCSTDTECRALPGAPADAFCSAKHCGNDEDNYTTEVCKEDDDCNLEGYTCKDELAFAECTDQFRTFGIGGRHCDYGGLLGPRGTANCESDQDCPGTINGRRGTCIANDVPSDKQSPLEFLFAKSFGIWRWRPTEGSATIGQCIGGTPVDGNACADNADCSQAGGACVPQNICNGGPLSGALNCSVNADCQGQNPDGVNRTICSRGADEFASLTCQGGPNNGEKCTRDVGERGVGCYSDNAVCSAGFCNGGAFENSIMTTPPCPSGWQEIGGRCRLSCANNNECRYGRSTCGATSQCNDGSGILAGLPCANNSQCNYSGSCRSTTITQPAGYQKIQDGAGASIGWDNREEATLNEQPFAPVIGSPDISACDLQSQKCRLQGLAIGINDFDCGASSDCPTGWTCGARTTFGGGGDTSGSTCVPPRGIDANALSINNRVSGELRAAGSYRAILRFYAWADHNTMPITSRSVDWGDGLVEKTVDSKYKNHKPTCSAGDTDDGAAKECGGMPGLTCAKQADCPAGTGLCVPVGRCSSSRTRCAVNEDCPLGGNGVERCVLSRFGNSPDACDEQYFEFEHTYVCNRELMSRLPDCVGADLDPTNKNAPHTACARDLDGNGSADSCLFRPKVQVRDNWGYCNGICPSVGRDGSPGGLRCYESECDAHPGAWTGFGGFITITPRN